MASRFVFTPENAQFPSSNFAAFKKDASNRGVLAFDAATAESAYWATVAPLNFSSAGNCAVVISYYMPSTAVGTTNVVFTANIEAPTTSEDLDSGTSFFAAGERGTSAVPTAVSGAYKQLTIELPPASLDGLAAGNYFRLGITRDVANVFDTASGDCHVVAVEFRDAA